MHKGLIEDIDIREVAPTIIKLLGLKIPSDIKVKAVRFD